MLTLMYFRAIYYLRRELRAKEAKEKAAADLAAGHLSLLLCSTLLLTLPLTLSQRCSVPSSGLPVSIDGEHYRATTIEEMRKLEEIRKNRIRDRKFAAVMVQSKIGHTRRLLREADELAEARQTLHEMVREQHEETKHVKLIQRYFRGFLARKAARRWALKLAEMNAVRILFDAATLTVQRYYRGHLGRDQARRKRAAFAHFIDLMRTEESREQQEYFENMQQISHYAHNQYEKGTNLLHIVVLHVHHFCVWPIV